MPLAAADFLSLKQNKKSLSAWCGVREMWVQTWPLVPHPLRPSPRGQAAAAAAPAAVRLRGEAGGVVLPKGRRWGSLLGARAQICLLCLSPRGHSVRVGPVPLSPGK